MDSERINRHLALQLGISRREADELIEKGRVKINDIPANLGDRVSSDDTVSLDDTPVKSDVQFVYLMFHKPVGYVCSRRAQGDAPTIYELIPPKYHALKPVGRLDKNSSGLILLTNDGAFAHQMTHPSFRKTKIYEVGLDTPLQPLHQQMISDFGVMLEDGKSKFMIEKIEQSSRSLTSKGETTSEVQPETFLPGAKNVSARNGLSVEGEGSGEQKSHYKITMSEGRNRQIRRTFAALGYTIVTLHRTTFGPYHLGDLAVGKLKEIAKI